MTSAHARFRRRLDRLADEDVLAGLAGGPGSRHYARFHPDRPVWATVVVEVEGRGLATIEVAEAHRPGFAFHPGLGHVRTGGPADDPALPGLGAVVGSLRDAVILRYRPGKRCTLRGVDGDGQPWVVKVLAADPPEPDPVGLRRRQRQLTGAVEAGCLTFRVAAAGPADRPAGAFWQGVVPGRPIEAELLGPDGPQLARRLGRALGELAQANLAGLAIQGPADQWARTVRTANRLVRRVPELAAEVEQVCATLAGGHRQLRPRAPVPVHGAPHLHQWLVDGELLGLIDFDRHHRGEPELDIATLVAELESEPGLQTSPDAIEAAAVAGFESLGSALDGHRLALYRAHKRLAKATRSAWSLRPDGDERAARDLRRLASYVISTYSW